MGEGQKVPAVDELVEVQTSCVVMELSPDMLAVVTSAEDQKRNYSGGLLECPSRCDGGFGRR